MNKNRLSIEHSREKRETQRVLGQAVAASVLYDI